MEIPLTVPTILTIIGGVILIAGLFNGFEAQIIISDARLVTADLHHTRVEVVADRSGDHAATIGANEFTPRPGAYYQIVVSQA